MSEPTPGDLWWHEARPDRTIDPDAYRVSAEAKALAHEVCDTCCVPFTFISEIKFPPGEVVISRYLADADGRKYLVGEGEDREPVMITLRYPWPVAS